MRYQITHFSLEPDYNAHISQGGTRPLIAKVQLEMPGTWSKERPIIVLNSSRLEQLLDTFQSLALEQLAANLTRDDDSLIGRRDVVPAPRKIEDIIASLSEVERSTLDEYVDAAVLRSQAVTAAVSSIASNDEGEASAT